MRRRIPGHEQSGLTLIELLASVVIFGVLVGIIMTSFSALMPQYRLHGAARQLLGDLLTARMKAISQNRRVQVFFLNNHQYNICDDANNDGTVDNCEGQARMQDVRADYPDVSLVSNNSPIFFPEGMASNLATITLTNTTGSKSITISPTGRVSIN